MNEIINEEALFNDTLETIVNHVGRGDRKKIKKILQSKDDFIYEMMNEMYDAQVQFILNHIEDFK